MGTKCSAAPTASIWTRLRAWLTRHRLVILTVSELDARRLAAYDAGYAQAALHRAEDDRPA